MRTRFLEAQDELHTNHGKFLLVAFEDADRAHPSALTGAPLLASLPPVKRFHGAITPSSLWLLDLQTQEGMLFDPTAPERALRRRFLVHPLHVCLLYWPVMRYLARSEVRGAIWALPGLVTLPVADVADQPGVLLDATGARVKGAYEWSARRRQVGGGVRLRNREVGEGDDPEEGQDVVTPEESAGSLAGGRPRW
jgi:hypothetical protein